MATAPLGQNLSVNLGVNPFATAQRRVSLPVDTHDGFSDDRLSYSVADDWGKLASQALADYEARIKNPRTDIWGRVLTEDTPAALDQQLFQPLRNLFGGGSSFNAQRPQAFETDVGVVERDPVTGSWVNRFPIQPRVNPDAAATKMHVDELQKRRRDLMQGIGAYSAENKAEAARIGEQIDKLLGTTQPATNAVVASPAPEIFFGSPGGTNLAAPPIQGSFIGTPGGANSFSSRVSPFAPTNNPSIKTSSGNKFKITTR